MLIKASKPAQMNKVLYQAPFQAPSLSPFHAPKTGMVFIQSVYLENRVHNLIDIEKNLELKSHSGAFLQILINLVLKGISLLTESPDLKTN